MKKKRTWTALILIAALILIFAAPANCEAEDARILLMRCYQQDRSGVCSEAVLLDEEGVRVGNIKATTRCRIPMKNGWHFWRIART